MKGFICFKYQKVLETKYNAVLIVFTIIFITFAQFLEPSLKIHSLKELWISIHQHRINWWPSQRRTENILLCMETKHKRIS